MTTNQKMFLYAVEEMNFTKAAERAFVTQQCLSNHISRLEKEYQTRLFNRTPKLSLTADGESLYRAFTQIRHIEENVQSEINGAAGTSRGTVHAGISQMRAPLLVPAALAEYHREYPQILTQFHMMETSGMYRMLEEGKLDFFLGADAVPRQGFEGRLIAREHFYLFATGALLVRSLPDFRLNRTVITPRELEQLPFTTNPDSSNAMQQIMKFQANAGIRLNRFTTIDSYVTQLELCRIHESAFIAPECVRLSEYCSPGWVAGPMDRIYALRIQGFEDTLNISLVTSENHYLPRYIAPLMEIMQKKYSQTLKGLAVQ